MRYTGEEPEEYALTKERVLAARAADTGPRHTRQEPLVVHTASAHTDAEEPSSLLHVHILGSGSKGNCTIVEGPRGYLMIDCGFAKRTILARMADAGLDPVRLKGIVLTHEHTDHVKGVDVVSRAFDIPIYTARGTAAVPKVASLANIEPIDAGSVISIADIEVQTFCTSHDAADPIGMRMSIGTDIVGYATDTGILSPRSLEYLTGCRILALESNHDVEMLKTGPYPGFLKTRIAGAQGHLSNDQSCKALAALLCDQLECVVGMHLSETNNLPNMALDALRNVVSHAAHPAQSFVASQSRPMSVY